MKRRVINTLTWNAYVIVLIGGRRSQWLHCFDGLHIERKLAEFWCDHMEGLPDRGATVLFDPKHPGYCHVYFPRIDLKSAEFEGAVAHEMFHATYAILRKNQVQLHPESEEAFAYLLEYLTREFWTWARKAT